MLISVLNIKVTCEWHKAIKLNYKNTRTTVVFVLRFPRNLSRPQLSVISPRSLHNDVSYRCLVAGHAQWTTMASRTAYSTWTPQKPTLFDGHYLHNRSTLDIGVLGYIGIVQHKEHSPEVLSIPPETPCIYHVIVNCQQIFIYKHIKKQGHPFNKISIYEDTCQNY